MSEETTPMLSRRRPVLYLLFAAFAATAFRWRRADAKPGWAEKTPPGDRYRTLSVGSTSLYLREDVVASGWYRDFRSHPDRKTGG